MRGIEAALIQAQPIEQGIQDKDRHDLFNVMHGGHRGMGRGPFNTRKGVIQMKKVALITGATGGLGRALALEHVRHGGDVILVARHAAKLQALSAELRRVAPGQ